MNRARAARSQGMSMFWGFMMLTSPTAPNRFNNAARSPADCMCEASGPGIEAGAPDRMTTSLPRTSSPAKSS